MRVSLKWLSDFVDITVPPDELAARLTMAGLAVEGIERAGEGIEKVFTGKILGIEPHPNADKLFICRVTLGSGDDLQIVTGATNVLEGQVVPVAVEGARLAGGLVIKRAKLRGVESRGMLCSGQELGLDPSTMPQDQAHGIMILDPGTVLGQDIKQAIGLDDVVLELELTPNRGDCLSMLGVAREVAALLGQELRFPRTDIVESGPEEPTAVRVDIDDPGLCGRYVARLFKNVRIGPSPRWMQERLKAAGIRPISNIVDITNYVMMELGQPLHAFDYDKLKSGHIIVRSARKGEVLVSLDGVDRVLKPGMPAITDPGGPVAVAGIMGGLETEVTGNTSSVLLESAYFNPVSIRIASRDLGLGSEASARFERSVDAAGCRRAADRAARLILDLGCAEVAPGVWDNYPAPPSLRTIILKPERVEHILGKAISPREIEEILSRLEFSVRESSGQLLVTVPSHRPDVFLEEDLVEELARMYGYDRFPATLPYGPTTRGARTPGQSLEWTVKDCLVSLGLTEVVTYSFTNPAVFDRLGIGQDDRLRNVIRLQNPLTEEQAVMRTTILPGLLQVLQRNASRRVNDLAIFEIGGIFLPVEGEPLPREKKVLGAAVMGAASGGWNTPARQYDFFYLKGVLEELMGRIRACEFRLEREEASSIFHPGRSARVLAGNTTLGTLGELHPDVAERYDLSRRACVMEIDFEELFSLAGRPRKYDPLPRYPGISRDLAVVAGVEVAARDIMNVMRKHGGKYLADIRLFDIYSGDQVKKGFQSLAFNLNFQAPDRTLTDAEIGETTAKIAAALANVLGAELRS